MAIDTNISKIKSFFKGLDNNKSDSNPEIADFIGAYNPQDHFVELSQIPMLAKLEASGHLSSDFLAPPLSMNDLISQIPNAPDIYTFDSNFRGEDSFSLVQRYKAVLETLNTMRRDAQLVIDRGNLSPQESQLHRKFIEELDERMVVTRNNYGAALFYYKNYLQLVEENKKNI